MLSVQTTPKMEANSIRCCSDRWFRGSNSKMRTWLTPDDRHPYTFTPIKNINSISNNGPRYNVNATFRFSPVVCEKMADKITAINNTIKLPEKSPTLKVVHGLCCSPNGGTRRRFIAFCRSPDSNCSVTHASHSEIIRSISLLVKKCEDSTFSLCHLAPSCTRSSLSCFLSILRNPVWLRFW